VHQARHRAVLVLVQGVRHVVFADMQFVDDRKTLLEDRVIFQIIGLDQGQVVRGDGHGKFFDNLAEIAAQPFGKFNVEQGFEGLQVLDAVPELPLPVIPFADRTAIYLIEDLFLLFT
jgi:hypothetical protein